MKFEELELRLRAFENQNEEKLNFEGPLIARLDGRGFTRLTKSSLNLDKPFDQRFHEAMKATVAHLCDCGFSVRLALSHSDEISLLFERSAKGFDGKARKWLSVLAGEASAAFSLYLGHIGAFDCRIIPLTDEETVIDYFRWRQSDALRNALNAHCYWLLRSQEETLPIVTKQASTKHLITKQIEGLSVEQKQALLSEHGIELNRLPLWQTRGFAAFWKTSEKIGFNPHSQVETRTTRRRLHFDTELPIGDAFGEWLKKTLADVG